jgi:hypothetical protein
MLSGFDTILGDFLSSLLMAIANAILQSILPILGIG